MTATYLKQSKKDSVKTLNFNGAYAKYTFQSSKSYNLNSTK